MTKSDMIGAVDDDDDEITDHEGIRVQVQRSRVGIVMDDDDDNDPNGVVRGVLVIFFNNKLTRSCLIKIHFVIISIFNKYLSPSG